MTHRFSRTVRFGNTPRPSGIRQSPRRANEAVDPARTLSPAKRTSPLLGPMMPAARARRVDFPAPFAPRTAVTTPSSNVASTPWITSTSSYAARTARNSKRGSDIGHGSRDRAEIGGLDLGIGPDLRRRPGADDAAVVED